MNPNFLSIFIDCWTHAQQTGELSHLPLPCFESKHWQSPAYMPTLIPQIVSIICVRHKSIHTCTIHWEQSMQRERMQVLSISAYRCCDATWAGGAICQQTCWWCPCRCSCTCSSPDSCAFLPSWVMLRWIVEFDFNVSHRLNNFLSLERPHAGYTAPSPP